MGTDDRASIPGAAFEQALAPAAMRFHSASSSADTRPMRSFAARLSTVPRLRHTSVLPTAGRSLRGTFLRIHQTFWRRPFALFGLIGVGILVVPMV